MVKSIENHREGRCERSTPMKNYVAKCTTTTAIKKRIVDCKIELKPKKKRKKFNKLDREEISPLHLVSLILTHSERLFHF